MSRVSTICVFWLSAFLLAPQVFHGDTEPVTEPSPQLKEIEDFSKAAEAIVLHPSASRLDGMRVEVLQNIYNLCGLRMPEGKKVTVVFGTAQKAAAVTVACPTGAHIIFNVPAMQQFKRDYKEVFQHEMLHAVQYCWWGRKHTESVPAWIQEGLGTYVGGNGPRRVARFKGNTSILNGLGNHQFAKGSDYTEDYLAVLFIEHTWGVDALKKFVRDITIEKAHWETALKKVTGLDFKEFAARARTFAIAQLTTDDSKPAAAQNPSQPSAEPRAPNIRAESASVPTQQVQASLIKLDLGISAQDADGKGVLVIGVADDGAAARAGIEAGDVIVSFNTKAISNTQQLREACESVPANAPIRVECLRNGKRVSVQIGLAP